MIETIQKRITTVDSDQPTFSKWWWIGAIRKILRPVRLNQATWITTESSSATKRPPTIESTISWRVETATAPMPPPRPGSRYRP